MNKDQEDYIRALNENFDGGLIDRLKSIDEMIEVEFVSDDVSMADLYEAKCHAYDQLALKYISLLEQCLFGGSDEDL